MNSTCAVVGSVVMVWFSFHWFMYHVTLTINISDGEMNWWRSSLCCFFGGDWSYMSVVEIFIDDASHTALAVGFMQFVFGIVGSYCLHANG